MIKEFVYNPGVLQFFQIVLATVAIAGGVFFILKTGIDAMEQNDFGNGDGWQLRMWKFIIRTIVCLLVGLVLVGIFVLAVNTLIPR